MLKKSEKVVGISNWHLFLKMLFHIGGFLVYFVVLWIICMIMYVAEDIASVVAAIGAASICIVLMINVFLYWKNSGIYLTKAGDHVLKHAGWFETQDKLVNGVLVASQVSRNPIDQLFGMASIDTGMLGGGNLSGVRYADIQKYDDRVRERMDSEVSSIF